MEFKLAESRLCLDWVAKAEFRNKLYNPELAESYDDNEELDNKDGCKTDE